MKKVCTGFIATLAMLFLTVSFVSLAGADPAGSGSKQMMAQVTKDVFGSSKDMVTKSATPPPVANFTANPTSGTVPLNVQFTNQSTGSISANVWSFGDGGSSREQSPSHTYTRTGTFSATLRVSGLGGTRTKTQAIQVRAGMPEAEFTASTTLGIGPLTVQFTNNSTGVISSYKWDFGDGSTSTAKNPNHRFTKTGTFNVILTVTGPGGTATSNASITVQAAKPVANFTAAPASGYAPMTVRFTNRSTGDITSYAWDFGDGSTSTDKSPSHVYANAGNYNAVLTVTGPGGTVEKSVTIKVNAKKPVANFTASPTSGKAPLTVNFTNRSTGTISSYAWSFGDGSSSDDKSPSHKYTTAGTYRATLTATGPAGTGTKTVVIRVR